jgi:hypothetical protein
MTVSIAHKVELHPHARPALTVFYILTLKMDKADVSLHALIIMKNHLTPQEATTENHYSMIEVF